MMLTILRSKVAHSKLESIRRSRVKCSLCSSRARLCTESPKLQTSNLVPANALQVPNNKKSPRRKVRFTELLEVDGSSLNEMKTKVKKLSSRNFVRAVRGVAQPKTLSSEKAHAITRAIDDVEDELHADGIDPKSSALLGEVPFSLALTQEQDAAEETLNEVISKPLAKETFSPVIRKKLSQLSQGDHGALSSAGKGKSLQESLLCYLELCVSCGFTHRGWVTLNHYVKSSKGADKGNITDQRLFDVLMQGYASCGQLDKLLEVWTLMESINIEPSIYAFATRIEAIARSNKHEKTELLNQALMMMEQKNYDLNDMVIQTPWVKDSQEVVLEAIRVVKPKFSPLHPAPDIDYDNPLLNHLNDKSNTSLVSPAKGILHEDALYSFFIEQLTLEKSATVTVKSVEKEPEQTELLGLYRERLDSLMKSWEQCILTALNREIAALNSQHKNHRMSYIHMNLYPYLVVLEKRQYVDILMQEIRKLAEGSETFSPGSTLLHRGLGHQVRQRYIVKKNIDSGVLDKMEELYKNYVKWYLNPSDSMTCNGRQQWQTLKHQLSQGPNVDIDPANWPPSVLTGIGRFLYKIILRDIKVDVNIMKPNSKTKHCLPAFYTVFRHQGVYIKEELKPHPVLSRLFRVACLPYLTFNVNDTPSLCPPIPWSSLTSGGYIVAKTNLIRLPQQAVQQWERMKDAPQKQLFPCYDSLNQLSSIPWRVNQSVLDTIIKVFNNGGSSKLDIPEPPSSLPLPEKITPDMNDTERSKLYKKQLLMRRKKAEMYSLWCDALYRLSLAHHFRDRIFWLPHNMDFRGRVYPCPPHLNHLGSDLSRSLLLFAKGEPLGPKGLDWLKIHVINLTGLKKRNSLEDRLQYANSILNLIIDSAENPLDGEKWWMESEEPWQTLACCIEIRDAINSPDGPENFVSRFPVHQDGSCNGLQHYAALGRDAAGAFSVNLAPAPEPQDVYSAVAAIVERVRAEDAANGVEVAQVLEGFVKRKVIKQTVMTTVYGVTRFGARLQIAKQLKDIDDFPKEFVWNASHYLASKTFDSIREMFSSTREIQDWFTESARMISQICGRNVEYVTPLGLPVVHPYVRIPPRTEGRNNKVGNYYENRKMDMFEKPNVMKQKNAFPPNFIHSLDSSHMMLTSLHTERAGITFVSVHDCFWTHACSVEIMNRICREQFVGLHSQPILRDLSRFMYREFGYGVESAQKVDEKAQAVMAKLNKLLITLPRQGDFELKNVLESVYFFS
uniref:DNA-directed RNA polymerase n=1 Tax=Lygus hesperus TaxID=30085 RepID=A0A0K8SQM1_LYGHE